MLPHAKIDLWMRQTAKLVAEPGVRSVIRRYDRQLRALAEHLESAAGRAGQRFIADESEVAEMRRRRISYKSAVNRLLVGC